MTTSTTRISGNRRWTAATLDGRHRWGDVYNPAHGEPSARVAFADASGR